MNLATSHHWLKVVSAHVVHPVLLSWWRLIYDLNRSMHKSNSSSRDALIRYDISIDQHLSWLTASLGKRQRWVPSYIQSTSQAQKTCFNVQIICCQNRLMTSTHTNKQTNATSLSFHLAMCPTLHLSACSSGYYHQIGSRPFLVKIQQEQNYKFRQKESKHARETDSFPCSWKRLS